jgi:hypothetical protein
MSSSEDEDPYAKLHIDLPGIYTRRPATSIYNDIVGTRERPTTSGPSAPTQPSDQRPAASIYDDIVGTRGRPTTSGPSAPSHTSDLRQSESLRQDPTDGLRQTDPSRSSKRHAAHLGDNTAPSPKKSQSVTSNLAHLLSDFSMKTDGEAMATEKINLKQLFTWFETNIDSCTHYDSRDRKELRFLIDTATRMDSGFADFQAGIRQATLYYLVGQYGWKQALDMMKARDAQAIGFVLPPITHNTFVIPKQQAYVPRSSAYSSSYRGGRGGAQRGGSSYRGGKK